MTLSAFGMNLHAATTADGRDRKQLERICRYLLCPPFAHDAVTALPGGRVRVSFKAPWRSVSTPTPTWTPTSSSPASAPWSPRPAST
jgi:hypothetical protein